MSCAAQTHVWIRRRLHNDDGEGPRKPRCTRKAWRVGPPASLWLDNRRTIVRAVDKREDFDRFTPIETMAAFGERIKRAAGHNHELMPTTVKLGETLYDAVTRK